MTRRLSFERYPDDGPDAGSGKHEFSLGLQTVGAIISPLRKLLTDCDEHFRVNSRWDKENICNF